MYNCDILFSTRPQVLLKNMSTVSIPAVMDPLAFESVLSCAYTGQLRMLREDIVNYLTVGSVLQMWHIVDKCTELLREGRAGGGSSGGSAVPDGASIRGGRGSANLGCSSSNGDGGAGGGNGAGSDGGGGNGGQAQVMGSNEPQRDSQAPSRPSVSESQSPSSTNYFSPRDGSSFGGSGAAAAGASVDLGRASNTPSYCTPSGGEEAYLNEEEEEDVEEEEEEVVLYHQRKRRRGGGSGRRKKMSSASEQEVGVSDSFGVSSYQVRCEGTLHTDKNALFFFFKRPSYFENQTSHLCLSLVYVFFIIAEGLNMVSK